MLAALPLLFLVHFWTASVQGTLEPFQDADYDVEVDVEVEDTLAHTVNVVAPPAYEDHVYVNIKPNSVVGFVQTPTAHKLALSRDSNDFNVEVDRSNIHTLKVLLNDGQDAEAVTDVDEAPEVGTVPAAEVGAAPTEEKGSKDALAKTFPSDSSNVQFLPANPLDINIPSVPYPSFPTLPVFTPPPLPMFNPPDYNDYFKSIATHNEDISKAMKKLDPSAYVLNFYLGF